MRDYIHVHDVASANINALQTPFVAGFVAFNIGTGHGLDVNEFAARLHHLCRDSLRHHGHPDNVPAPTHGLPRAGDLRSNLICPDRAAAVLNWRPQVLLPEGLRSTVEWFAGQVQ